MLCSANQQLMVLSESAGDAAAAADADANETGKIGHSRGAAIAADRK
jgi:hypothetical protein